MFESLSPTLMIFLGCVLCLAVILHKFQIKYKNSVLLISFIGILALLFFLRFVPPAPAPAAAPEIPAVQTLEQAEFNSWYAEYSKQINTLDTVWQKYHRLIRLIRDDDISILKASIRMDALYEESLAIQSTVENLSLPKQLSLQNQGHAADLIKKTKNYSNAHHAIISKSKDILDSKNSHGKQREELIKELQELIILKAPSQPDILPHIAKIKDNIAKPIEEVPEKD